MKKIKKISALLLLGILCMGISSIAEEITLTTYYPAPYGVYEALLTDTLGVGDNDGSDVLDSGDTPTNPGDVWIAGNVGIGTTEPDSSKGSEGYLDVNDVYLRDTGTWASEGGGFSLLDSVTLSASHTGVGSTTRETIVYDFPNGGIILVLAEMSASSGSSASVNIYSDIGTPTTLVGYNTYRTVFYASFPDGHWGISPNTTTVPIRPGYRARVSITATGNNVFGSDSSASVTADTSIFRF